MKTLFSFILVTSYFFNCYATPAQDNEQGAQKIITDFLEEQAAKNKLELLRKHVQVVSNVLWLEKSEKNIATSREVIRRYFIALEKFLAKDKENAQESVAQRLEQLKEMFTKTVKEQERDDQPTLFTTA